MKAFISNKDVELINSFLSDNKASSEVMKAFYNILDVCEVVEE